MVMPLIKKSIYGAIFTLILPLYLWWLNQNISLNLPGYREPYLAISLLVVGLLLIIIAMADLFFKGKGLPMNAYPPKNLVINGVYALIPHPIYVGFNMMVAGLALYFGSATALWLILPLTIIGCLALVWGYERLFLLKTFNHLPSPWLGAPERNSLLWRLGSFLALFLSWLIIYEAFVLIGAPPDAVDIHLAFETNIAVCIWSYPVYASAYFFVVLPFLFCRLPDLKCFFAIGWSSIVIVSLCYAVIPVISPPRLLPELAGTESPLYLLFYHSLSFEMQHAAPFTAAFPSYHVIWSVLVALFVSRISWRWAIVSWIWAGLIIISCFTTGMHALLDLLTGIVLALFLFTLPLIWQFMIKAGNQLANSYRSIRIGPIRIMNHFISSFLAAFLLVFLTSWLLGVSFAGQIVALASIGLLGAVLWGWLVEGASLSMRPLGYFGAVLLFLMISAVSLMMGYQPWPYMAALFCAAPFAQVVGRLRCIIQGCCHGREIRFHQAQGFCISAPRSRVVSLSNLQNKCIYPTQFYSMLGNLALGLLLFRLWSLQVDISLIIGLYLTLTGFLRFVEEGYRGEIQTGKYCSLASYQWLCILFVILGTLIMTFNLEITPVIKSKSSFELLTIVLWALFGGLIGSVDFPDSNKPFSRLER